MNPKPASVPGNHSRILLGNGLEGVGKYGITCDAIPEELRQLARGEALGRQRFARFIRDAGGINAFRHTTRRIWANMVTPVFNRHLLSVSICNQKRLMLLFANHMKTYEVNKCCQTGAAAAFIEATLETGRIAFDFTELLNQTGLSSIAAKNQLQRLRGRVVRVSRHQAFFLIVESQHRPMGAPPVEWWLDAYFRWLGHPYYLALQSAAEIYNSAPQAILVKQVMTDAPRRDLSIGRIHIRFFVKRHAERTPVQQPSRTYAPLKVSTPEATALDMVRYASRIGGMERVTETLTPLLPLFRAAELRRALEAEGETTVAQRLGYLIENADRIKLAELVHQWLPSGMVRVPLESSKQTLTETARSRRWRVLVPDREGA